MKFESLVLVIAVVECALSCGSGGRGSGSGSGSGGGGSGAAGSGEEALRNALGGDLRGSEFAADAPLERVSSAADLSCDGGAACSGWRNARNTDTNDFARIDGQPYPDRWEFMTETAETPDDPFLLCAQRPGPASDGCEFESAPIECLPGEGLLSFKHWTSISRDGQPRPKIEVCARMRPEGPLEACQEVIAPSPGPSEFKFNGPVRGPFQIVIRASTFVNSPEGGLVAIDDIEFTGDISESADDCPDDGGGNGNGGGGGNGNGEGGGNSGGAGGGNGDGSGSASAAAAALCSALACDFESGDTCGWNAVGEGASGLGITDGWQVVQGQLNAENRLTGIRDGDALGSTDAQFALAQLPDPHTDGVDPTLTYVLQSAEVDVTADGVALLFDWYLATQGAQLSLCRDAAGADCLWDSGELIRGAQAQENRSWRGAYVPLPQGTYTLHLIARYDGLGHINRGQVGVDRVRLADGADPFAESQPLAATGVCDGRGR